MATLTHCLLVLLLLLLLLLLASGVVVQPSHVVSMEPGLALAQPFGPGVHRTYWLVGGTTYNWNGSLTNPGPLVTADDGDNVTIMLQSSDGATHSWFLDFNDNFILDSNEVATRSLDFRSTGSWLDFTFATGLGTVIPHGGNFTYRCQQHAHTMFGTFKFNGGPVASFSHSPPTPLAGRSVTFDASTSWPTTGATITNYNWNFGDGNTTSSGRGSSIFHTYATNKTYTVILNITDSASQTAGTSGSVTVLSLPPIPFDYQIATSANVTIFAGQSTTVLLSLSLTSGTAENVTLSILFSPLDPIVRVSLPNVTTGFPPFPARLSITTTPSSFCSPAPCLPSKTYTITIRAVSNTGVDHSATFSLTLKPTPPEPPPTNYTLFVIIGITAAVSALTVLLILRRRRERRL